MLHRWAGYRSARPILSAASLSACNARPVHTDGPTTDVAATVADACRGDVVMTMLANDDAVESVVRGARGVLASLAQGAIHISSSTISVATPATLEQGQGDWREATPSRLLNFSSADIGKRI